MLEICKNIYKIPVALPGSPLKELNAFLIKGEDRSLLIDTGFCAEESRRSLFGGLNELSVDIHDTDVFLTHFHADHAGLVDVLKNKNNRVYISEADSRGISRELNEDFWSYVKNQSLLIGFPRGGELDYREHPAYIHRAKNAVECSYLKEGDELSYGGYTFTVLDLKGHTPGQLGLYEKESQLLFSGDHILNKITPNICCWDFDHDYLGYFLENLKKVEKLKVKTVFSGHRAFVEDPGKRIGELLAHHARRLENARQILRNKPSTAYECSRLIKWDFLGGYFPNFPVPQQWFASSEMLAHLQMLYLTGEADRELSSEGFFVYHLR
jgi:glyoxylase-like metal-dependent hydrolase (beta-lactamase superfamily II)